MKARFNNGKITVYEQLPETFNNGEISIIGEMDKLTKEELEALGFYDLVKPPIDEATQRYANIIWCRSAIPFFLLLFPCHYFNWRLCLRFRSPGLGQ